MFAVKSSKVRKVNNFHVRPNTTLFQCVPQQLLFEYNGRTNDKNKWENNEKKIFLRLFFLSFSRKQKDQLLAEKFLWANLVEWHRFHFFLLISCVLESKGPFIYFNSLLRNKWCFVFSSYHNGPFPWRKYAGFVRLKKNLICYSSHVN